MTPEQYQQLKAQLQPGSLAAANPAWLISNKNGGSDQIDIDQLNSLINKSTVNNTPYNAPRSSGGSMGRRAGSSFGGTLAAGASLPLATTYSAQSLANLGGSGRSALAANAAAYTATQDSARAGQKDQSEINLLQAEAGQPITGQPGSLVQPKTLPRQGNRQGAGLRSSISPSAYSRLIDVAQNRKARDEKRKDLELELEFERKKKEAELSAFMKLLSAVGGSLAATRGVTTSGKESNRNEEVVMVAGAPQVVPTKSSSNASTTTSGIDPADILRIFSSLAG